MNNKIAYILYILFLLLVLAFIPFIAFYLAVTLLLIQSCSCNVRKEYMLVSCFVAVFGLVVTAMSNEHFAVRGDDFTTYYNNYLDIYQGNFMDSIFQFSGGVEVGVPLINYILYIIIGEPLPYVFKFFHIFILLSLTLGLCLKICNFFSLNIKDFFFIVALSLVLIKLNYMFLIMRQGYASLFIAYAIFSTGKRRYLYWILSCLFHLSSLLIFPLALFIVKNRSYVRLRRFVTIMFSAGLLIFVNINILSGIQFDNFILAKLMYALTGLLDNEMVIQSILTNIKGALFFLVPFIVILMKRNLNESFYPFIAMLAFVISTSYFPSLSFRVTMPIYAILTGYLYFNYLGRTKICLYIIFPILIFNLFNSTYLSTLNYERYPMFSTSPFYYISSFFEERNVKTDRFSLPAESNKVNKNKL